MAEGLSDKAVIVTGAGGGIGRAVCVGLTAAGASVLATDLSGADLAGTAAAAGSSCEVFEADVTSAADWDATLAQVRERFGAVHGLVNNAGVEGAVAPMAEYPEDVFDRVLAVNVKGVWLGMRTVGPAIAEHGGGAIVNLSSVAGLGGSPGVVPYSASKHAVIGLTRSAALELAPSGVRVTAVCPSPVETRMMRSLEEGFGGAEGAEQVHAQLAARIPLGRYASPEEVAGMIVFLLGDGARFVSGAVIAVDGAMTAS